MGALGIGLLGPAAARAANEPPPPPVAAPPAAPPSPSAMSVPPAPSAAPPAAPASPPPAPAAAPVEEPPPPPFIAPPRGSGPAAPLGRPSPSPAERLADGAAAENTPFVDLLISHLAFDERYSSGVNIGVQGGAYVAKRLRLAARALMPTGATEDDSYYYYDEEQTPNDVNVVFGASAGVIAVATRSLVFAPSIAFLMQDALDYGTFVGLAFPVEWTLPSGVRFGVELDLGRSFGGERTVYRYVGGDSPRREEGTEKRPFGTGIMLQFNVGTAFGRPEPAAR